MEAVVGTVIVVFAAVLWIWVWGARMGRCPSCGGGLCDDTREDEERCARCGTWYPRRSR